MPSTRRTLLIGAGLLASIALLTLSAVPQVGPDPAPAPTSTERARRPAPQSPAAPAASVAATHANASAAQETYWSDRVMIRPASGQDTARIASDHGGSLLREPGRSGWAAMSVPQGAHIGAAVERLREDPRVLQAGPVGIMRGAGTTAEDLQSLAWDTLGVRSGSTDSSITVAVLDSGVAYENYTAGGVTYVQAPTLADTPIRYPYDFVNDDTHANDDHMHGTHIASIIASQRQSKGDLFGVASGVGLMPIKVLDADNKGSEADLVDGIWHAIDNGADVINMSLAFGETYVPSAALQEALREAHAAGVILVAATGNDASDRQAWPAASPYVIGVASACPDSWTTWYANATVGVSVTGIGGCMNDDADSDGYPDGLVGETIVAGDPSKTQTVLWAGTSQAAATVSGIAARHLSDGATPAEVPTLLQSVTAEMRCIGYVGTCDNFLRRLGTDSYYRYWKWGAGIPVRATKSDLRTYAVAQDGFLVAVLPYLHRTGTTTAKPAALVHVVSTDGTTDLPDTAFIAVRGSTYANTSCDLVDGACHFIDDEEVSLVDADGNPEALGWAISVEAVMRDDKDVLIEPGMFVSDGLEVLVAAMQDNPDTAGLPLGIYWPDDETPRTGMTTAEAYAFVNSGVGFASSPMGVLLSPGVFPSSALSTATVDLDGTGFTSSPLGTMDLTLIEFGGTGFTSSPLGGVGFSSSPLGLSSFTLAAMDGVGFSSSPLGLDAFDLYTTDSAGIDLSGVGFTSSPLGGVGFSSSPLNLATGTITGASATGTEIEGLIDSGGWTIGSGGYSVGTGLVGSSMVDMTPEAVANGAGAGWRTFE